MSKYSGKCDICDIYLGKKDNNWDWEKVKIYAYNNTLINLDIKCEKDLIPYFPYLAGMMYSSKDKIIIWLSEKSFVDDEEEEILQYKLSNILRKYKSCKRKKIDFIPDDRYNETELEIFNRVKEYGEKANIKDIHLSLHDYYRQNLYTTMLENGYDEDEAYKWVYGLKRYFDKEKENE